MDDKIDSTKGTARSAEFSASKPLPPIGMSKDGTDMEGADVKSESGSTDQSGNVYQDDDQKSIASSAAFDRPGEGSARPLIVRGFRPEAMSDEEMEAQRAVSFKNGPPVTSKRRTYDGREIMFVTLNTQTDWDWVEKVELDRSIHGDDKSGSGTSREKRSPSPRAASSRPDMSEETEFSQYQMPYNDEYGIPILDLSSDTDDSSDDETSHKKVKDDRMFMPSVGPPNILQWHARFSGARRGDPGVGVRRGPTQYQRESEKHDIPVEDPDARLPDTDDPNFEKDDKGKTHGMFSGCCEFCSKPIKPFPTLDQQLQLPPETLYCCDDYRDFVEFVLSQSNKMEEEQKKKNKLINIKPHEHVGSKQERNAAKEQAVQRMRERELQRRQQEASGLQQNLFASGTSSKAGFLAPGLGNITMKDMYAGGSPRRFLESGGAYVAIDPSKIVLECLDSCPSKYRNLMMMPIKGLEDMGEDIKEDGAGREMILGDLEAKTSLIGDGHGMACEAFQTVQIASTYLAGLKDRLEVARQMKTINYQLSSQKCLEEGWTLRAPSPLLDEEGDDVFIPEPLNPAMIADGKYELAEAYRPDSEFYRRHLRDRPLIEKFYESGKKFLTMFPDGTGNVFYPSGNLAILISSVKLGQYYYTIHLDINKSGVVAVFEPNGIGYCYFPNGDIRLYLDQYGGLELDNYGARRRKWSWRDQITHVHAPPFQPICIGLNRHMGVRVMSQDNIALTFSASQRSCRFNMGSKLKLVAPENAPLKEVEEEYIFLEEKKNHVDALLNKVANLLKFPNNPKLDKMLPPLHLTTSQKKTEKMKKDRQIYLAQQSAREKKQSSISVNS